MEGPAGVSLPGYSCRLGPVRQEPRVIHAYSPSHHQGKAFSICIVLLLVLVLVLFSLCGRRDYWSLLSLRLLVVVVALATRCCCFGWSLF